jgi:CBS domain-containing membrane protein
VDRVSKNGTNDQIARVCVVLACGYLRAGGATTITRDCRSYEEFEHEVDRLKHELDSILERAKPLFGEAPETSGGGADLGQAGGGTAKAAEQKKKPWVGAELRVRDLMTGDVKTLARNDKLSVADELMTVARFRPVVVLDDDGDVAGVVSQRNIFYGALGWSMGLGRVAHQKALESVPAKDVMESNLVTVHPDTPLSEAAETMMERKIGCLPVVEGNRLVGILTEGDFLTMLAGS